MFNPFFIYCYAYIYVLVLYAMKWSNLFSQMSISVIFFLIVTLLIMFILGLVINKKIGKVQNYSLVEDKNILKNTKIILILHIINMIYGGTIPLWNIIRNTGYLYTEGFDGIPLIQTFLLAFSAFYATYSFDTYLSTKNKKFLFSFIFNILPFVLLFYRSTLVIIILNCTWVYLLRIKRIKFKIFIVVFILFLFSGYLFGLAGDARTANQYGIYENQESIITNMGQASEEFMESKVPKQYFWLYLYSVSPLANFQNITDIYTDVDFSTKNILSFINNEIVYDVFSLRINDLSNIKIKEMPLIVSGFNVSTIYGTAFMGLGWLGVILIFIFMLLFSVGYILLIRKNKQFFRVGIATLNTIIFLCIFDNMFVATSLSLQLIFPFFIKSSVKKQKHNLESKI